MPTFRPLVDVPKLLVGPMVRRVTMDQASFFLATKVECQAEVKVYAGPRVEVPISVAPERTSGLVDLHRLGDKLWIGVVTVDVSGLFPGKVLSYDVELVEPDGTRSDLYRLGLLGNNASPLLIEDPDPRRSKVPLGYEPGVLPAFRLPPNRVGDLHIVHASCRKPHGGMDTEADAMQLIDAAITASRQDAAVPRPHQLVLTGDQIYADDVAGGLLVACRDAGKELLGWDEQLPLTDDPTIAFLVNPGWRTRYLALSGVDIKAVPTAGKYDYSANHLLRFAEWVGLYLFSWSDVLWERDINDEYELPGPNTLLPDLGLLTELATLVDHDRIITDALSVANDEIQALTPFQRDVNKAWKTANERALGFAESVRHARRVLANVPTYTMFDDHEVTDDWYVSKRVHDELKGRASSGTSAQVGPRLLRNGLSAYAFFQHWGNVPADFQPGTRGAELLDLWTYDGTSEPPVRSAARARDADALLDIGATDAEVPRHPSGLLRDRGAFTRMRWDYAIEFPTHRLIALDTRTWRHFPADKGLTWAQLAAKLPAPAGDFATAGLVELEALLTELRAATPATAGELVEQLADLLEEVLAMARATPAGEALGSLVGDNPTTPPPPPVAYVESCVEVVKAVYVFVSTADARLEGLAVEADEWLDANEVWFADNAAATTAALTGTSVDFASGTVIAFVSSAADAGWGLAGTVPDLLRGLASLLEAVSLESARAMLLATGQVLASVTDSMWRALLSRPETVPGSLATHVDSAGQTVAQGLAALPVAPLDEALLRNGDNRLGVGLLRQDAVQFQFATPLADVGPDRPVTVLLSPAPIFGNGLVELAQRVQLLKLLANGKAAEEEVDFEPWTANVVALRWLLEAAPDRSTVVVLSGDVHYAGSSVTDLVPGLGATRFIQLTSSASRNSDGMTRGLATLDDLLYTDEGKVFFLQSDFTALLEHGASSVDHLEDLALSSIERSFVNLADSIREADPPWVSFEKWLAKDLDLPAMQEAFLDVVDAPRETLAVAAREASWRILHAAQVIEDFAEDPVMAVMGDFVTAGPLARQQLQRLYVELGLDPSEAVSWDTTVIVDRRPDRLDRYPVKSRLADLSPFERRTLERQHRRTVGHANAGFITFDTDDGRPTGLHHEIRWYPHDTPPAGDHPLPRGDWYGTLHTANWLGRPATQGTLAPPNGLRPAATATCWNPLVADLVRGAVDVATSELADWRANPAWTETTTAGGARVQHYWQLFTRNTTARMQVNDDGETAHWSAAFISWCFARAYLDLAPVDAVVDGLDPEDFDVASARDRHRMLRQARSCMRDRGYFYAAGSHYRYVVNTTELTGTNALVLAPDDPAAAIQLGDLVYAGRTGTTYAVRNGRLERTSGDNFFSHADLVTELGDDADGPFAIVVGGNVGDRVATKVRRLTTDGLLDPAEGQEAVLRLTPEHIAPGGP